MLSSPQPRSNSRAFLVHLRVQNAKTKATLLCAATTRGRWSVRRGYTRIMHVATKVFTSTSRLYTYYACSDQGFHGDQRRKE